MVVVVVVVVVHESDQIGGLLLNSFKRSRRRHQDIGGELEERAAGFMPALHPPIGISAVR
ncbi:hypothetical protein ACMD2_18486 [Ananas comosus]|uniref:Uncharacterized protein n=1 Tax=Ananas comosus TaxID=4615 RepID=A0A199UMF7_ANACO|nr:hypothetical protein ACMD2_18486 [Ananas comosus]